MIIKKDERIVLGKVSHDMPHRVYELRNGDVFTVKDTMIEFEDGKFYEVIEQKFTFKNGIFPMKRYKRTGKEFTIEELNKL